MMKVHADQTLLGSASPSVREYIEFLILLIDLMRNIPVPFRMGTRTTSTPQLDRCLKLVSERDHLQVYDVQCDREY